MVAVDSRPVAKETIRRLGSESGAEARITPDELLDNLRAEAKPDEGTMLIRLTYTDTNPQRPPRTASKDG